MEMGFEPLMLKYESKVLPIKLHHLLLFLIIKNLWNTTSRVRFELTKTILKTAILPIKLSA